MAALMLLCCTIDGAWLQGLGSALAIDAVIIVPRQMSRGSASTSGLLLCIDITMRYCYTNRLIRLLLSRVPLYTIFILNLLYL